MKHLHTFESFLNEKRELTSSFPAVQLSTRISGTPKGTTLKMGDETYTCLGDAKWVNSKGKKIHQAALIGMSMGKEKQIELTHYVN
jgi:hypothetical protein